VRHLEHVVDHVVELLGQGVDVLAVEGGDEGRVEPLDDGVDDLVAPVLALRDLVVQRVVRGSPSRSRRRRAQSATLAAESLKSSKNASSVGMRRNRMGQDPATR
jgi:hypothetical protein